ncbi:hypothetical protein M6D81_04510 [Paenibacillus sp. J5C_2022]|uniref:hypothetical protein n=1 Tax=Paenibacillus sp. J5C2022 TaxID=2977129 RepID=UPI0021D253B5|nr:hypothetical protein [Paenibacillus sp. J5C2022]MCU6707968.1 hypothetical protein [Paenibacillus sp. J5C2022]
MSSIAARKQGMEHSFLAAYFVLLLLFTVYQDFPLVTMIGEIGRTPIVALLPVFVFCEVALLVKHKAIKGGTRLQAYVFGFIVYLSAISLAYILVNYLMGQYSFGSEALLAKGVKVLIYFILILLYIRHVQLVLAKLGNGRTIGLCFLAAVTFLLGIMVVELATMPNALTFLHSGDQPYWRVRLLTSESSTTGSIIVVFTAILIYLSRYFSTPAAQWLATGYAAAFFFFYTSVTGSKGFLIIILLTLIVTMAKFLDFRKKRNFVLVLAAVAMMYVFIAQFAAELLGSFSNDIENYTSSYTRMGTILIAVLTVLHHPLGVGTGAYPIYFNQYMGDSISLMSGMYYDALGVSQINVSELLRYSESTKNLGVKSGFFQWFMFGGLFSVAFFYLIARNLIAKAKASLIMFMALVFILFSLLLVSLEIKYEIWLLFAFISMFMGRNDYFGNINER